MERITKHENNGDGSVTERTYILDDEGDLIQIETGETYNYED